MKIFSMNPQTELVQPEWLIDSFGKHRMKQWHSLGSPGIRPVAKRLCKIASDGCPICPSVTVTILGHEEKRSGGQYTLKLRICLQTKAPGLGDGVSLSSVRQMTCSASGVQ